MPQNTLKFSVLIKKNVTGAGLLVILAPGSKKEKK